ncbi:MAG: NUDIX hydrolase [Deltaproteobacteria bacterium]|nr:NUDIX hydrolase [Deltaproteobacteria bacterium]
MKEYSFCPICGASLQTGMIEGKERKYCPQCDFVDYKNPLPVALAIAIRDKDFLLIKRGIPPKKGVWASPSGFIEIGETAEQACLRELKEETGVSGEIVKYLVKVRNEELNPGTEAEDARFFSVDELPGYYLELFKEVIDEVQNNI